LTFSPFSWVLFAIYRTFTKMKDIVFLTFFMTCFAGCSKPSVSVPEEIVIDSVFVNDIYAPNNSVLQNIDYENVVVNIRFKDPVDTLRFSRDGIIISGNGAEDYSYSFRKDSKELLVIPEAPLLPLNSYRIFVDFGENMGGIIFGSFTASFHTRFDDTPKFPEISDDSLLTLVQKQTFGYFWDHAHPVSGLARERLGSGDLVTSGGSGFGLMAIVTGIERGFITRREGFERILKIVNFLNEPGTDRFHGAFPHWLNGTTGKTIPFSAKDNGGDLVETAFLIQGLLTAKEYFSRGPQEELSMCDTIQKIWEGVEWDWYRQNDQNKLYWHWSPDYAWEINMPVTGWNEALIVYVLAAASPTSSIPKTVYDEGWARNGAYPMLNGKSFYDIRLPLGEDFGGPLFFAHYSFLGLDPRNLEDQYTDYWTQNIAHSRINYEYCVANPKKRAGYGDECWGLSASDIQNGYSASSPTNDLGVIAPTAAISSFPYTPVESMKALKFFYYTLGDKIWDEYGFHDSFNLSSPWFANSYLAIDQGPIVCMIENYRSGLLWDLFMSNRDVRNGLDKLGFTY